MEKKQRQYEKYAKVVKDQVKRYQTEKQLIEHEKAQKASQLKKLTFYSLLFNFYLIFYFWQKKARRLFYYFTLN